ncbi:MAG: lyase family protein, partial [Gammaproteobacteria bacterium]
MTNDNTQPASDNALNALTPLDGRYREQAKPLADYFSEAALIRRRVFIELEWLKTLRPLLAPQVQVDDDAIDSIADAVKPQSVKDTEQQTRHDLKAAEVCIARQLQKNNLGDLLPLLHFACTSWDINNLAQTLMLRDAVVEVMLPQLEVVTAALDGAAKQYAALPMLSRTHGQPASPTTVGKEFANFAARLDGRARQIRAAVAKLPGK